MNAPTGRSLLLACAAAIVLSACPNEEDGPKCAATTCSGHGTCSVSGSNLVCACDEGYGGTDCSVCALGYQDKDGDKLCSAACSASTCNGHGACDDRSGTAVCSCKDGYSGAACADCAAGYQDKDSDGTCSADCATANLACGAHGACSDATGTAVCGCAPEYTGAACDACAAGYQDNDHNSSCAASCATAGLDCGERGSCSDTGGTAVCVCQTGYAGAACESCAANYQDNDNDGACAPGCTAAGYGCNGHGTCIDTTGVPVCTCTTGYTGERCNSCATNFQDNDHNGSCTATCATANLSCGSHGSCGDTSGTAVCVCTTGYTGATCSTCATGYELSGGVCVVSNNTGASCSDPIVLSGQGSVTGTTLGAANNGSGSCAGSSSGTRPDRLYTFTAQARTRYQFLMEGYDTVLHLRSTCENASSQLACNDDTQGTAAGLTGTVEPGTYYLFADSYSSGGSYTLTYSLRTDPCANDDAVCPGTPQCVAEADWGGYECVCPAGTVAYNGSCVDDPCEPNPCTTVAHKNACVQQLATSSYVCQCGPGYIDDGSGGCMTDPNANEWTFMVFLNGDNNLDSYADSDIREMQAAGSNSYVNIIVLHDSSGANDTKTLRILPGSSQVVQSTGEKDMGNWQTLRDFGVWTVQNYPARHYALVMWDHGDGWKAKAPALKAVKGFSNDDNGSGDGISISNGDYAKALAAITAAAGGKLDVVGFDACLMGMYEVAKATAPYANYLVGSEETEPGDGWSYNGFLPGLVNNHTMNAETLGRSIVDAYYNADSGNPTLALTNLGAIPTLDTKLSSFADALRANSSLYANINSVRNATQAFYTSEHLDLYDFAKRISLMSGAPQSLKDAANALMVQLARSVIVYNKAQGSGYSGASGLAIYLPGRNDYFDSDYVGAGATWSTATTWDDFLQSFLQ